MTYFELFHLPFSYLRYIGNEIKTDDMFLDLDIDQDGRISKLDWTTFFVNSTFNSQDGGKTTLQSFEKIEKMLKKAGL